MPIRTDVAAQHEKALRAAETFRKSAADLIDTLQWMDRNRGFAHFNCTSLYHYATEKLRLSADVACSLIAIARKSNEVPALKEHVRSGAVTVTGARRIASVITPANQEQWLSLASNESTRVVEKEVARANPRAAVIESTRYVTAERLELKLGISEKLNEDFKRAADVLAQKRKRKVSLEELIAEMTEEYLWHHDPVAKAERSLARSPHGHDHGHSTQGHAISSMMKVERNENDLNRSVARRIKQKSRRPLCNSLRHQVTARDKGQCTETDPITGKRCQNKRWVDIHHIKPVSHGGEDRADNLQTLCWAHHRQRHSDRP